jgi:hypothetical protein
MENSVLKCCQYTCQPVPGVAARMIETTFGNFWEEIQKFCTMIHFFPLSRVGFSSIRFFFLLLIAANGSL